METPRNAPLTASNGTAPHRSTSHRTEIRSGHQMAGNKVCVFRVLNSRLRMTKGCSYIFFGLPLDTKFGSHNNVCFDDWALGIGSEHHMSRSKLLLCLFLGLPQLAPDTKCRVTKCCVFLFGALNLQAQMTNSKGQDGATGNAGERKGKADPHESLSDSLSTVSICA